jgi:hypothetical protein
MVNIKKVNVVRMVNRGGKAFIVRGNVSDDLWQNHLKGEGPALGIIPITENNSCRWGCIDIDEYDFDHHLVLHY